MIISDRSRYRGRSPLRILVAALSVAAITGCAVGPEFTRQATPDVSGYIPGGLSSTGGEAPQRFIQGKDLPMRWWTLFHSQPLNALVEQSLKSNSSLDAAEAALRVARETAAAQRGSYFPSVQAGLSSVRERNAGTLSSPLESGNQLFSLTTAQVNVSYLPDVFGGNRRRSEALQAQSETQGYLLQAAYLSLTANVVAAAVQEASLRGQITAAHEIILAQRELITLTQRLADLGAVARAAVVAQQDALAQSETQFPQLEKQLAQQRDLLLALSGRLPDQNLAESFELSGLELPQDLPVSLPSRLVDQRPDVRAAEAQLHVASAEVGVATAALFPEITLSASSGSAATLIGKLFAAGTGFWSVGANAAQTLFQGGSLLHGKRAAEADYQQAAAQYRGAVINAFQNVADTLYALQADADADMAASHAERAAATQLAAARRRLGFGDISRLDLLAAEVGYQQAVATRAQTKAARLADTVALFQALGGGWGNAPAGAERAP